MNFGLERGKGMLQILGMPFKQDDMWPSGSIEGEIIKRLNKDPVVHAYQSLDELSFELKLRKNIIASARAMNQGDAAFDIFENSRCNPQYWYLTRTGGFRLRYGVLPSDAIQDIFTNSSLYAFECAMAIMIIYYHAVLKSIGEDLFNQIFSTLYLYSWHFDPDLGLQTIRTNYLIPGDVVYFNNPDYNPNTFWWRGENSVVLEDGTYFGHGLGIRTAKDVIQVLNNMRISGSIRSSYMTNIVTRLSFKHLKKLSTLPRSNMANKIQYVVIHHNKCSISYDQYLFYLNNLYSQMRYINPFPSS